MNSRAGERRGPPPRAAAAAARRGPRASVAWIGVLLACLAPTALCGCGSQGSTTGQDSTASVPTYATEPYTPQQQRVAQGAHLVVSDGCAACHLAGSNPRLAPSFTSLAGHRVALSDGRRALVDERFLRESLLRPRSAEIAGYDPRPMLAALQRLHLSSQPAQVAALVAFIEQVGPETE